MKNVHKLGWKGVDLIVLIGMSLIVFPVAFFGGVYWVSNFFDSLTPDDQIMVFVGAGILIFLGLVFNVALDSEDDIDSGPGGPL